MKGKKELLAKALYGTRLLSLWPHFPNRGTLEIRILAYHRILDVADESRFPFDPELISASTSGFQEQIEYVARHFVPITCADLLAAVDEKKALPPRAVIITFDDGHIDNYTNAFPVLRSLDVPATIFLSTDYIGADGTFWFDQVSCALFRAPVGTYSVPGLQPPLTLSDVASRREAGYIVREHLKSIPDKQRREKVTWIVETFKASAVIEDAALSGAMTWEQVREMSEGGIEFGSHAISHPMLTQLDDEALEHELVESRRKIAEVTGRPVNVIAYPDGGSEAFDTRVMAAVRRAGYELGLGYIPGRNFLHQLNRFAAFRLHVERYTSRARFQAMLELPGVFGTK